jgi:hypothetical protein
MRILHIDSGRELRGGQHQLLLLIEGLRRHRVDVRLLARAGSPLLREARERGFDASSLGWLALREASAHCDLVHCHDSRTHTMAWLASRAPFVVARRVAYPVQSTLISRKKYGAARCFLSISPAATRELLAAGVSPERIALVPDGVDVPPFTSSRTGSIVALDSGDPGKCGALLHALPQRIEFTRDLTLAFRSARMFVYASQLEGLGSAALLAMAYGVPVVASNVTGLRETVTHDITGLLADNTVDAFERAIVRLEHDHALAGRLAAAGRAEVEINYSAGRMVERTLACYAQVLK